MCKGEVRCADTAGQSSVSRYRCLMVRLYVLTAHLRMPSLRVSVSEEWTKIWRMTIQRKAKQE